MLKSALLTMGRTLLAQKGMGKGAQDSGFCPALCIPHCRLTLMCPEGQGKPVRRTIEVK